MIEPKFKLGDNVKAVAFVNCFKQQVDEVPGLTVTKAYLVECKSMASYYRYVAENPGAETCMVEGAERFFELERSA